MTMRRRWLLVFLVLLTPAGWIGLHSLAAPPSTAPVDGPRPSTPGVYALTNLRLVPEPGWAI